MCTARKLVEQEENENIPVAQPPSPGRPLKNASKFLKSWFEKGAQK